MSVCNRSLRRGWESVERKWKIPLLALAFVLAWGMINYYGAVLAPIRQRVSEQIGTAFGNSSDLYPPWTGARELLYYRRNPYTPEVTAEIQRGYYGRTIDPSKRNEPKNLQAFAYPVYVVFYLAPFLLLPFRVANGLFIGILILATAASVSFWMQALRTRFVTSSTLFSFLAVMSSFPFLDGLYWVQMTLLVNALIAGALAALARRRFVLAGILLALATVKPQLTFLVVIFTCIWAVGEWRNRRRLALAFSGGMAALLLLSETMLPGWFGMWRHASYRYITYNKPSLLASLLGNVVAIAVAVIALILCIATFWRLKSQPAGSPGFNFAVVSGLVLTTLVLPNAGGSYHYQILLIPVCLWLFAIRQSLAYCNRAARVLWWITAGMLASQWVVAFCVSLIGVVYPLQFLSETRLLAVAPQVPVFVFPIVLAWFVLTVGPEVWRRIDSTATTSSLDTTQERPAFQ